VYIYICIRVHVYICIYICLQVCVYVYRYVIYVCVIYAHVIYIYHIPVTSDWDHEDVWNSYELTQLHYECLPESCVASVLQYVAVCCSVLQCVAVCCSVLQMHYDLLPESQPLNLCCTYE